MDNIHNQPTRRVDNSYEQLALPIETEPQIYRMIQSALGAISDPAFSTYINQRMVTTPQGRVYKREELLLSIFDSYKQATPPGHKVIIRRDTDIARCIDKTVFETRIGKFGIQEETGSLLVAESGDHDNKGKFNLELKWRIPNRADIEIINRILCVYSDAYAVPVVDPVAKPRIGRVGRAVMNKMISNDLSVFEDLPRIKFNPEKLA